MMDDKNVVRLLAACETAVGNRLRIIRKHLRSDQWLGALWELIVLEAAAALGSVQYEPVVGDSKPDIQLDSYSGERIFIEVAFLQAEESDHARKLDRHLAFRVLNKKGRKADRAGATDPYLVFLGTDRIFDIVSSRYSGGVGVIDAVMKAFCHRSLSAVVLVPIFAIPETFEPLEKRPRPSLYTNTSARTPLTDKSIDLINRFDFERWPFDRFTRRDPKRLDLRLAISFNSHSSTGQVAEPAPRPGAPYDDSSLPYPCWTFIWRFNRLRIARIGNVYWLFKGRDFINVSAKTPEEVAQVASELFQMYPAHVVTPGGVDHHPDHGVPADLGKWTQELPHQSA